MVELVLVACLLKDPSRCETFRQPFMADINMIQCVWESQFRAAEWSASHPDWVIRKFTCEMPEA